MQTNLNYILGKLTSDTAALRRDVDRIDGEVRDLKNSPSTPSQPNSTSAGDLLAYLRLIGAVVILTLAAVGLVNVDVLKAAIKLAQ
jgi:hypothetical protein